MENSLRAELRSEIELLKTLHADEILGYRLQIQSLLDANSTDAFQKTQLEKTCEDLRATVSDLSSSLTKLRDTHERAAAERTDELRANAATLEETLDDLAEARSNVAELESQLEASQEAQGRIASELDDVKSTLSSVMDEAEIAATTQAKTLDTVRAALAEAEKNFVAAQNAHDKTAEELKKVRSELSAAKKRNLVGLRA